MLSFIAFFLQTLKQINTDYKGLFGKGTGETESDEAEGFNTKWGWIAVINNFSNNDRMMWDYYLNMNVISFLNTVVFFKEKVDEDLRLAEQARRGYKSKL